MITEPPKGPPCGARATFWPDDEACEAECILPAGHAGTVHEDAILGEWDEGDLSTVVPDRGEGEGEGA